MITALEYSIKAFFHIAVQGYPKDKGQFCKYSCLIIKSGFGQ